MREGRPSFTAAAVAAARGLTGVDALADVAVTGILGQLARRGGGSGLGTRAINAATVGLLDHIELRTLAIDAGLRRALEAGPRQLVVLGAGLDGRAYRMPELGDVHVFEVDHPATQRYKMRCLAGRPPRARLVTFVSVDFEKDALGERLDEAGHDTGLPTIWLWEGVTMYLKPEAMRETLRAIGDRSGRGSWLLVTYVTPRASSLGKGFVRVASVALRVLGEALRGRYTPGSMADELGRVGFRVEDDSDAFDWARRHGGARRRILVVDERLAVAEG